MATIARITAARVTHYRDNGETRAYIDWVDSRGKTGTTTGKMPSAHIDALLARAKREGIRIVRDEAGWTPSGARGWNPNHDPKLGPDATEFQRRRNMVGTTVRHVGGGPRSFTVALSNRGSDLGSKTEFTKRGKVVQTLYVLPPLPEWLKQLHPNGDAEPESFTIDWDELPKLFKLPSSDDVFEGVANSGVYGYAYDEAIEEGLSEDEAQEKAMAAEQEVQDDLYKQYTNAVESVAEKFFELHGLGLNSPGNGTVEIFPEESWRDAANKIRETINGVGMFEFATLEEFLDSGPYTPEEAVREHLHWIPDYARVYGDTSPQQVYERAMR